MMAASIEREQSTCGARKTLKSERMNSKLIVEHICELKMAEQVGSSTVFFIMTVLR